MTANKINTSTVLLTLNSLLSDCDSLKEAKRVNKSIEKILSVVHIEQAIEDNYKTSMGGFFRR